MSRKSVNKGKRGEAALEALLRSLGLSARRTLGSGSAGSADGADIQVFLPGCEAPAQLEVKLRSDGFREEYRWLEGVDALVKKADNREWLITFRLKDVLGSN